MKLKLLLSAFFIMGFMNSYSQNTFPEVKTTIGKKLKIKPNRFLSMSLFTSDENTIFTNYYNGGVAYGRSSSFSVDYFDLNLNHLKSLELDKANLLENSHFHFFINIKNTHYYFSRVIDKENKKNKLYVQTIDLKTNKLNSDIKQIAEIDYSSHTRYNMGSFNYILSSDKSKLFIYYQLPYEKKENEEFGFHVFDEKMNELWKKNIELPYKNADYTVEGYSVNINGEVSILGKVFTEKKKIVGPSAKRKYQYQILIYKKEDDKPNIHKVELSNKYLIEMHLSYGSNNELICNGFYSESYENTMQGYCFIKIDPITKKVIEERFTPFTKKFMTEDFSDKELKKVDKNLAKGKVLELSSLKFKNIIHHKNGNTYLIAENSVYYITTTKSTDSKGVTTTTTTHHYINNDIIVINLDAKGNTIWIKRIPKHQSSINDGGFRNGYYLKFHNDNLYFVFNGQRIYNKKNSIDLKLYSSSKIYKKKSAILVSKIDSKGELTTKVLMDTKDAMMTSPKFCLELNNNETVFKLYTKNGNNLMKLTFE